MNRYYTVDLGQKVYRPVEPEVKIIVKNFEKGVTRNVVDKILYKPTFCEEMKRLFCCIEYKY